MNDHMPYQSELERLQIYFETEVVGIIETAADGKIARVNRGIAKLLGYNAEELVGLSFNEITDPKDRALSSEFLERLNRGEIDVCQFEKRYLSKTGEVLPVLTSVQVGKR